MKQVKYIATFLDKKSSKDLQNWFKLKTKKELYNNICSNCCVLSIVNSFVSLEDLSPFDIGQSKEMKVVGYLENNDDQVVLVDNSNVLRQICVSTNNISFDISKYKESDFRQTSGPSLSGVNGYLSLDNKITKELNFKI